MANGSCTMLCCPRAWFEIAARGSKLGHVGHQRKQVSNISVLLRCLRLPICTMQECLYMYGRCQNLRLKGTGQLVLIELPVSKALISRSCFRDYVSLKPSQPNQPDLEIVQPTSFKLFLEHPGLQLDLMTLAATRSLSLKGSAGFINGFR